MKTLILRTLTAVCLVSIDSHWGGRLIREVTY